MSRAHVQFKYHAKQRDTSAHAKGEKRRRRKERCRLPSFKALSLVSFPLSPPPSRVSSDFPQTCMHPATARPYCSTVLPFRLPPVCIPPNGSLVSRGGCPKRGKNGASMHAAAAEKGRRDILIRKKEGRGEMRGEKKTRLARSSPTTFSFFPSPVPLNCHPGSYFHPFRPSPPLALLGIPGSFEGAPVRAARLDWNNAWVSKRRERERLQWDGGQLEHSSFSVQPGLGL